MPERYNHSVLIYEMDSTFSDDYETTIRAFREWSTDVAEAIDEYGSTASNTSWPNAEEELKRLSLLFPDKYIRLDAVGSGGIDDISIYYFYQGKMQDARVHLAFDPFDPLKCDE